MNAKDILYLGLGAAFLAKDKLESRLRELEERGEMTREEVSNFLEDARARADREEQDFEKQVRSLIRETASEMGLATRQEVEELKARLDELEKTASSGS